MVKTVRFILCMLPQLKEKPALAFSIFCREGVNQQVLERAVFPLGNKVNNTCLTLGTGWGMRGACCGCASLEQQGGGWGACFWGAHPLTPAACLATRVGGGLDAYTQTQEWGGLGGHGGKEQTM